MGNSGVVPVQLGTIRSFADQDQMQTTVGLHRSVHFAQRCSEANFVEFGTYAVSLRRQGAEQSTALGRLSVERIASGGRGEGILHVLSVYGYAIKDVLLQFECRLR